MQNLLWKTYSNVADRPPARTVRCQGRALEDYHDISLFHLLIQPMVVTLEQVRPYEIMRSDPSRKAADFQASRSAKVSQ